MILNTLHAKQYQELQQPYAQADRLCCYGIVPVQKMLIQRKIDPPSPLRVAAAAMQVSKADKTPPEVFRSFRAARVNDGVFPPVTEPFEMRLPRLHTHKEGPAPVMFAASAVAEHKAQPMSEMENMWLVGFLDSQKRGDADSRAVTLRRQQRAATRYDEAANTDTLAASSEFQRLMKLLQESHFEAERKQLAAAAASSHKLAYNPLTKENTRIRNLLLGPRKRGAGGKLAMRADGMDRLVLLERLEVQGAIVVQRFWRRELRKRFWRRFSEEQRAVCNIQVRSTTYLL
jgi:hypothetical protein